MEEETLSAFVLSWDRTGLKLPSACLRKLLRVRRITCCFVTCSDWNKYSSLFHSFFDICNLAPLSGLPLPPLWSGWVHFLPGRQKIPSSARCFGHTAMFKPSSSKWPERARIKYFSSRILVWDTLTALRWALISLWHDVSGKYSVTPGERLDTSQPLFEKVINEQESEAILHSARCCN